MYSSKLKFKQRSENLPAAPNPPNPDGAGAGAPKGVLGAPNGDDAGCCPNIFCYEMVFIGNDVVWQVNYLFFGLSLHRNELEEAQAANVGRSMMMISKTKFYWNEMTHTTWACFAMNADGCNENIICQVLTNNEVGKEKVSLCANPNL